MILHRSETGYQVPPSRAEPLRYSAPDGRPWSPLARWVKTSFFAVRGWMRRNEAWVWLAIVSLFAAVFLYLLLTDPIARRH